MTQQEAIDMATHLLTAYGDQPFEISLANEEEYDLMRTTFDRLGRKTGPDGEFFVVRVFARDEGAEVSLPAGGI